MKVTRLRFKGLTRFDDPVDLDFTALPPGIIAITGENGSGKTTVLEAMFAGYYGLMPSRPDRSLSDLVNNQRDAYIEVSSEFEGAGTILSRINIDGFKRVTEAILQQTRGTQTQRTDGKISTHKAAVLQSLPAKETLLASAFAAQNKAGSFSTLDRKGRKDLFAKLLGLEKYEEYAATSRAAALSLDRRHAQLQGQISVLRPLSLPEEREDLAQEERTIAKELSHARALAETCEQSIALRQQMLAKARQSVELFLVEGERLTAAIERRSELARQFGEVEYDIAETEKSYQTQANTVTSTGNRTRTLAQNALAALPTDKELEDRHDFATRNLETDFIRLRKGINQKIANNQLLVNHGDLIRTAVAELADLTVAIGETDRQIAEIDASLVEAERALATAHTVKAEYAHWPRALADAERDAQLLTVVPFGDQCADARCQFVLKAVEAKANIPACKAGVQRFEDAVKAFDHTEASVKAMKADHDAKMASMRAMLRRVKDEFKSTPVDQERLSNAEARLVELAEELANTHEQQVERQRQVDLDAEKAVRTRDADRIGFTKAETDALAQMTTALADIEAARVKAVKGLVARRAQIANDAAAVEGDIATLGERTALAEAARKLHAQRQVELTRAQEEQTAIRETLATLDANQKALQARTEEFEARWAERAVLEEQAQALATDLIEWQALGRIFGREGLPVLEIDAAGPQVSSLANDLLESCFSGRFAVELVTQEAKADGKGTKESFELKVYDNEHGGDARDLSDLSGGEQVIVDEALKSALALLVNSRNVQPIRTCWRDETAGALDPENADRYLLMLRRLRERGQFHHLFLIAHNPSLTAQADAQIVCKDGTATLAFPPFQEVA